MGGAKRLMEEQENQHNVAIGIAIDAGALEECEYHEGTYLAGSDDVEEAVELGREKFASGDLAGIFASVAEVDEAIRNAVIENGADECYSCDRHRDD
ncbi:hypothetical protein PS3A_03440 [Pseudomonas sp. 3A(2025)]